jgi:large subunit ribosomal protein L4
MRVLAELVILPLASAQLFQLPGAPVPVLPESPRAVVGEAVPGAAVAYADSLYPAPYYTTTEKVNGDAWRLPYSSLGLMVVAAFSASGFAIGRSVASLATASATTFGRDAVATRKKAPVGSAVVPVVTSSGEAAGETMLKLIIGKKPEAFGHIVHRKLVLERRNLRQGNASTKTRGEVRGGGRKPYKQKGTGNARRGSSRSPLIVGGGVTFGPKPKNWANKKLNRKEARLAISLAFQSRAPSMKVVKDLETALKEPKTKDMHTLLQTLGIGPHPNAARKLEATSVIVDPDALGVDQWRESTLYIAAKNIPYIKIVSSNRLCVYDMLRPQRLLVSEKALAKIHDQYGPDFVQGSPWYKILGDDDLPVAEEDGYPAGADNSEETVEDIIDDMEAIDEGSEESA